MCTCAGGPAAHTAVGRRRWGGIRAACRAKPVLRQSSAVPRDLCSASPQPAAAVSVSPPGAMAEARADGLRKVLVMLATLPLPSCSSAPPCRRRRRRRRLPPARPAPRSPVGCSASMQHSCSCRFAAQLASLLSQYAPCPCCQAMEGMVNGLDRTTMRPLQKDSYLCMAKCCDRCGSAGAAALNRWPGTTAGAAERRRAVCAAAAAQHNLDGTRRASNPALTPPARPPPRRPQRQGPGGAAALLRQLRAARAGGQLADQRQHQGVPGEPGRQAGSWGRGGGGWAPVRGRAGPAPADASARSPGSSKRPGAHARLPSPPPCVQDRLQRCVQPLAEGD